VRNLLSEPWSEESLAHFFGDRPVAEWFNTAHPRVKAGEVFCFIEIGFVQQTG